MKAGVLVFPGSNCDHDCYHVAKHVLEADTRFLWHKDTDVSNLDLIIVPGGFSYGDYLRCGAIARFSPIMDAVQEFAEKGGLVLGICNGFQILTECGLLPGSLMRNRDLKFICEYVCLRVENNSTAFTGYYSSGEVVRIPVAHMDGNFYADEDTIKKIEDNSQVVLRYCNEAGEPTEKANINGSINNIAGIVNEKGNVLGMMPHPDRCAEGIMETDDGFHMFASIKSWLKGVE